MRLRLPVREASAREKGSDRLGVDTDWRGTAGPTKSAVERTPRPDKISKSKGDCKVIAAEMRLPARSERFDDDKKHDADQRHSRQLVDRPEKSCRMGIVVRRKIVLPARKQAMEGRQPRHQRELRPDPAHSPLDDSRRSSQRQSEE